MTKAAPHTAQAMAEHWSGRASRFDTAASHIQHADQWRELFRAALGEGHGARAIDLGSGTGACALMLAELGYKVRAVDGSTDMLARAQAAAKERGLEIEFVEADMDTAELKEGTDEVVTLRNVLWTLENPQAAIHKARGLLRPGGRILVSDGIWRGGANESQSVFEHQLPYFNGISEDEARSWLEQAGFCDIASWQHMFIFHPYGPMYDEAHADTLISFFIMTARLN